jgi:hypothetical protein
MKHKAAAKTPKFWDGVWEPDMWLKTVLHKLYDRVPHSAEYVKELQRVEAVPPMPIPAPPPALPQPDAPALTSPDPVPPPGVTEQTPAQQIRALFNQVGLGSGGKAHTEIRRGVAACLASQSGMTILDIKSPTDLDQAQTARLVTRLAEFIADCQDKGMDPKAELSVMAGSAAGGSA